MSATNYPAAVDTDTQLLRRTGSDAIVPADHNNLVDAIEALEATVSTTGDGSENGGTAAFLGSLNDYAGFLSTAQYSVRHPFAPSVSSSEWNSRTCIVPASWTIPPGSCTITFNNPRSAARITPLVLTPQLLASAPVIGTTSQYVLVRLAVGNILLSDIAFGWSVNGLGTDLDGWKISSAGGGYNEIRSMLNGVVPGSYTVNTIYGAWYYVMLRLVGGHIQFCASADGLIWTAWSNALTPTGTYTKFCIWQDTTVSVVAPFFVDVVTFGTSLPAGWGGE